MREKHKTYNQLGDLPVRIQAEWDRVRTQSLVSGVPIIGEGAAEILSEVLRLRFPKRILEIGTGMGYSTYFLLANMDREGFVVTIDSNLARYRAALDSFQRAGVLGRIIPVLGDAKKLLSTYEKGCFDFVFIDAQKNQYCSYLSLIEKCLDKDGMVVADDTLFLADRGANYCEKIHRNTVEGLEKFRTMIKEDPWQQITFTVEDGISLIWKRRFATDE